MIGLMGFFGGSAQENKFYHAVCDHCYVLYFCQWRELHLLIHREACAKATPYLRICFN